MGLLQRLWWWQVVAMAEVAAVLVAGMGRLTGPAEGWVPVSSL